DDSRGVIKSTSLLQKAHAPDHVENRGWKEQQARDQSTQDRLRIPEDRAEGGGRARKPVVTPDRGLLRRQKEEEKDADHKTNDSHSHPESTPAKAPADHRSDHELARRSSRHAKHLRRADQSRGAGGREGFCS